jgi:DNA-binding transcriptional ArsR family regulator
MNATDPRQLDDVFVALADRTRRAILDQLAAGEARVTEVAASFAISLNSVSKHIHILERAGLVRRRRSGRDHFLSLQAQPLADTAEWLQSRQRFWAGSVGRLAAVLDAEDRAKAAKPQQGTRKR